MASEEIDEVTSLPPTDVLGTPLSIMSSPTLSFDAFREEYLRNRDVYHPIFAVRQRGVGQDSVAPLTPATVAAPALGPPSTPTPPPAPSPETVRRRLYVAASRAFQSYFSAMGILRALVHVLLATVLLFQGFSAMGYGILLGLYGAYKLFCFTAMTVLHRLRTDSETRRPSLVAKLVQRYGAAAPASFAGAAASQPSEEVTETAEQRTAAVTDEAEAGAGCEEEAAEGSVHHHSVSGTTTSEGNHAEHSRGGDEERTTTEDSSAAVVEAPYMPPRRLPRHWVFLYCVLKCFEVFFISLSPLFSIEQLELSLQVDGILQFTT